MRLHEIWATAALGELELGLGDAAQAAGHFERLQRLLADLGITDVNLSPAADLVDAYLRLGRHDEAQRVAAPFAAAADAKGQPWSLARALRCRGLLAADGGFAGAFEQAMVQHAHDPGHVSRRRGPGWLTASACGGPGTGSWPASSCGRQRTCSSASTRGPGPPGPGRAGRDRRDTAAPGPEHVEELTPQELQIAVLLTGGRTTREAAAALFLSPKTVEYHLRHVYQKLGIHSREELARVLAATGPGRAGRDQHDTGPVAGPSAARGR